MISITHNLFLIAMVALLLLKTLADHMKGPTIEVLAMDGLLTELPDNQFSIQRLRSYALVGASL
jgi:hypothetical protein